MLLSNAYLAQAPSDYIDGAFRPLSGDGIATRDPARPSGAVWSGSPVAAHAEEAAAAARRALPAWSALPFDARRAHLERWRETCVKHAARLSAAISREVGKVKWEAELEAKIVAEKVTITLEDRVLARVAGFEVAAGAGKTGLCTFKPHGVMAVLGPYNVPAHLPNGHIVPALLLGNTVVFKPSEKAASVGQLLAELAHEAGFPAGVFNVVPGGGAIAARLATHPEVDGVLFTGSFPVGRRILEANLDTPGRLIALEMDHGRWTLTDAARPVLRGAERIELRKDLLTATGGRKARRAGGSSGGAAQNLNVADAALLDALKALRRDLAGKLGQPTYVVFPDRTLLEMVSFKPRTLAAMRELYGIGETKLQRYGAIFLEVLTAS